MSSNIIAGVLRSKAWQAMKETLIDKQAKVGEKLVPAVGGKGDVSFLALPPRTIPSISCESIVDQLFRGLRIS
jgi:hypothetical protein